MAKRIIKEMLSTLASEKEYWEKEWCRLNKLLAEKEGREAELLSLLKEALDNWQGFMCVAYVENGKLIHSDELDEKLGRIAEIRKKISKAE